MLPGQGNANKEHTEIKQEVTEVTEETEISIMSLFSLFPPVPDWHQYPGIAPWFVLFPLCNKERI